MIFLFCTTVYTGMILTLDGKAQHLSKKHSQTKYVYLKVFGVWEFGAVPSNYFMKYYTWEYMLRLLI